MLDVHCDRCGRSGHYRLAMLVETYGLDAGLPAIAVGREVRIKGCAVLCYRNEQQGEIHDQDTRQAFREGPIRQLRRPTDGGHHNGQFMRAPRHE